MPTSLIHRIGIAAPAEKIYHALTTEEGIKAWWTTDVKMDAHADGKDIKQFYCSQNNYAILRAARSHLTFDYSLINKPQF